MLKAKDIMTRNVVYLKKNTPIVDSIRLMTEKKLPASP
jgi:CBS domain-containing protein